MTEVPKRPSRGPSEDDDDEDEDSQERERGNRKNTRFQKGKDSIVLFGASVTPSSKLIFL